MSRRAAYGSVGYLVGGLALIATAALAQPGAPVARVFGVALECADLGADGPSACAARLLRHVRARAGREFVARNALDATDAELERLGEYNRAFERHDRSQRKRKLAELDARLAADSLAPGERAWLEEFRGVLQRLARRDADIDAGVRVREPIDERTLRGWIETAKLNAALYAKYGGIVGLAAYGPYAHGAIRALIDEHIERGDIRILDAAVAERFFAALAAPPRLAYTEGEPDFTPFWERPIPSSYVAD